MTGWAAIHSYFEDEVVVESEPEAELDGEQDLEQEQDYSQAARSRSDGAGEAADFSRGSSWQEHVLSSSAAAASTTDYLTNDDHYDQALSQALEFYEATSPDASEEAVLDAASGRLGTTR